MYWRTPDEVYKRVRLCTEGALSDPLELYTKVKDAYEHGKLDDLADGHIGLVASNFGASVNAIPGNREAFRLVASRLGIDVHVLWGICAYIERDRPGMGVRPGTCRTKHRHNWNLPNLSENGVDTAPSSRVKRKYGETAPDTTAGLGEAFGGLLASRAPAATTGTTAKRFRPTKGFFEFRHQRLVEMGANEDINIRGDEEIEAETRRLWETMSKEEHERRAKESWARRNEILNKEAAEEAASQG